MMNPKKAYLLDVGFISLAADFSENKGRLLENLVAIELFRRQDGVFYYKDKGECDFVVKRGQSPSEAIQVCWQLHDQNRNRELNGLAEAMSALKIKRGLIVSYDEERTLRHKGCSIEIIPAWKWLIQ